ncbi:MAG: hypothetical protein ACM31C_33020 [Acidobacteriota bacterium]
MASRSPASILVLVLAWSTAAHAQSASAQAEVLFRQGRDLMAAKKYSDACKAFEASEKLDPAVTTLLNLADCREKNGQLATALATFSDAEKAARAGDDAKHQQLAQVAASKVKKLEPRLSKLTIHVADDHVRGLEVTRDGIAVDPATWNVPLPIDGGTYKIVARAPGRDEWSATVTVQPEADAQTVEVPALHEPARATAVPAPAAAQPEPEHPEPAASGGSRVPLVLGGGAVVLLGGALGFSLWGDSTYDDAKAAAATDYNKSLDLWHSANTKRYVAEGMAAAGVVAGGVAMYLWLHDRGHSRERSALAPVVGRDVGGVAWLGSW